MPEAPRSSVFTIPPHRSFADALAAGLLARHRDPMELARGIVLIPNSRARGALSDAFVRRAEGGGLLLPRLVVIGDPEIDETLGSALDPIGEGEPVPSAIEPMARRMRLANLVQQVRGQRGQRIEAGEAVRLAGELGRTLDQLIVDEVDTNAVLDAVEPEMAEHWRSSLDELEIVLKKWPVELERIGLIDLTRRRNMLLRRIAERWGEHPPRGFVVAAGITVSARAMAAVLRTIAFMERGTVVLPALDIAMPEEEWEALGPFEADPETGRKPRGIETHPQFQLKLLLDRMGVARDEVAMWRHGGGRDAPAVRSRAIGNAMKPAEFTGMWNMLPKRQRRVSGVRAIEVAQPSEEAQVVAIALREAIETPGRTAALVTPDRGLARRVVAHLERWGIAADDSAGRPLAELPAGTLLLAIAEAAAAKFAPVALLAMLKHPLARQGEGRLEWLDGARALDMALRGPRPAAGLAGVTGHLRGLGEERAVRALALRQAQGERERLGSGADVGGRDAAVSRWWREVAHLLAPLEAAFDAERRDLATLLAAIRGAATALAGDAAWAGAAGRAAAELLADLELHAPEGPADVAIADVAPLLERLMRETAVRPPQGGHPRVFIWGLLEARLQQADLMVLGGLNEGVWPALPSPDPWLAPKLRVSLGLPGLERRIGLAAHDFASALGAPQVLVTRARRDARGPAVASRFWLRLEAMTGGMTRAPRFKAWARAIDRPGEIARIGRPKPCPPLADRPRRISVTRLDTLKADPFAFYAGQMLKLRALDAVDADPSPAWRGSKVHEILDQWFREDDCDPARLHDRAVALLASSEAHPLMRALWQPRLIEAIDWIAAEMARNREDGRRPVASEMRGEAEIAGIRLDGRADRIDRMADGSLAVVDYKTGKAPSAAQVEQGFAMQLGLLGVILEAGGFEELEGEARCFEYWSMARKDEALGHVATPFGARGGTLDPENFVERAEAVFREAAARWLTGDEPFTAKLEPDFAYGDYDQLMRQEEWYGRG